MMMSIRLDGLERVRNWPCNNQILECNTFFSAVLLWAHYGAQFKNNAHTVHFFNLDNSFID